MSVKTSSSEDGVELKISVDGRFDFSSHQEFRNAYENADKSYQRYQVDMSATTYLDSSALGMLLLLRDFAGGDTAQVAITNCSNDVRKILTISNFEQLFTVR